MAEVCSNVRKQFQFIWEHLGAFRKIIIAGCLLMTKGTDIFGFLPDSVKAHTSWLLPCWPWYWWLIGTLALIAAFSIEESYVRQNPDDPKSKNNGLPILVLIVIGVAWIISVGICRHRENTGSKPGPVVTIPPKERETSPPPQPTKRVPKTPIVNKPKVIIKAPVTQKNEGPCGINNIGGTVSGIKCTTNPPFDPLKPVNSYFWNGAIRITTPGSGRGEDGMFDTFEKFLDLEKGNKWNALLDSATNANTTTPTWFTSEFFIGEANFKLCKKDAALTATQKFLDDTNGNHDYRQGAERAQETIQILNNPNYGRDCLRQQ